MNEKVNLTAAQIAARDPSSSFQDLLDKESVKVPDSLRDSTDTYLGCEDLPIDRWTSREFFDLEVEKMWRKTWQMACRESQLRNSGDYFVYDIVNDSILLTRTESGELKGYYNSCLHRVERSSVVPDSPTTCVAPTTVGPGAWKVNSRARPASGIFHT